MGKISSKSASTDLELVNVIKSSELKEADQAFNKLYKKYHDTVLFRFKGYLNDDETAQALVNEAFVKVSSKIATYNPENGAFSTWLFKMTKNLFIDRMRKKQSMKNKGEEVSLSDLASEGENDAIEYDIVSNTNTPDVALITKERDAKINDIVENLTNPKLKAVIKLRYFEGLTYEEIAQELNLPNGTVKAFLFRAKQELAEKFKEANIGL